MRALIQQVTTKQSIPPPKIQVSPRQVVTPLKTIASPTGFDPTTTDEEVKQQPSSHKLSKKIQKQPVKKITNQQPTPFFLEPSAKNTQPTLVVPNFSFGLKQEYNIPWVHTPTDMGNPGVTIEPAMKGLLQPHFVGYIVGKPGSGKTWILEELLLNERLYGKKFDFQFFFSPYPLPTIECTEGQNWFREFDVDVMTKIVKYIGDTSPSANILIILDDVIATIKKQQSNPDLTSTFFNRRKLIPKGTISFIITSQKYITLPPSLRSVLTWMIIFQQQGNDLESIVKENLTIPRTFRHAANELIVKHMGETDKHPFIYFNINTSKTYLNFEKSIN
jgi:hypothetical protein